MVTMDLVLETYYAQKPEMYWEIGVDTFRELKKIRDGCGFHLMAFADDGHEALLGYPIRVVAEKNVLRFITEVK